MEQYRNCNRNGCGRYPAQPNLMSPYANNRMMSANNVCETTRRVTETCSMSNGTSPIGMAYVPSQEFSDIYDAKMGLREGTMFPALNLIFCGVRGK